MHKNSMVVTCDVTMECLDVAGMHGDVEATFEYDPMSPYSATVIFGAHGESVPWTFGRDLLAAGRFAPIGEGDVVVHPGVNELGQAVTVLVLHAPEGSFTAQVRTSELEGFLTTTYGAVPAGREGEYLNIDHELAALLG